MHSWADTKYDGRRLDDRLVDSFNQNPVDRWYSTDFDFVPTTNIVKLSVKVNFLKVLKGFKGYMKTYR